MSNRVSIGHADTWAEAMEYAIDEARATGRRHRVERKQRMGFPWRVSLLVGERVSGRDARKGQPTLHAGLTMGPTMGPIIFHRELPRPPEHHHRWAWAIRTDGATVQRCYDCGVRR